MSDQIKIVEVGPRDGLQNEANTLSFDDRVNLIKKLEEAGLRFIEGGSFVSAKAIPQMVDSEKVWANVSNLKADISFLVPNLKGLERAISAGVKSISVFTATSDAFNSKNIGMTVRESLDVISQIALQAKATLKIRGYISTAFGCPYEGLQSEKRLFDLVENLLKFGCYEVSVGDTIGVAHPKQVKSVVEGLKKTSDISKIALHLHDTRGMALANIQMGLDRGVKTFDSSIGGLGGCPYAEGSSGNIATEEVAWLMQGWGLKTGISIEKTLEVSKWIETKVARKLKSKLYLAQPKRLFYVE